MLVFYFLNFSVTVSFLISNSLVKMFIQVVDFFVVTILPQKKLFQPVTSMGLQLKIGTTIFEKGFLKKTLQWWRKVQKSGGPLLICCRFLLLSSLINLQNLEGPCPPPFFPAPLVLLQIRAKVRVQSLFEIDKDKACLQVSLGTFQT